LRRASASRWDSRKPVYLLRFSILAPKELTGHSVARRLYCTSRALWKLNWFLRDFGYDTELLGQDEIDDKNLVGLRGVVKISHVVVNGTSPAQPGWFRSCQAVGKTLGPLATSVAHPEVTPFVHENRTICRCFTHQLPEALGQFPKMTTLAVATSKSAAVIIGQLMGLSRAPGGVFRLAIAALLSK